jgi:hypothetical protein
VNISAHASESLPPFAPLLLRFLARAGAETFLSVAADHLVQLGNFPSCDQPLTRCADRLMVDPQLAGSAAVGPIWRFLDLLFNKRSHLLTRQMTAQNVVLASEGALFVLG